MTITRRQLLILLPAAAIAWDSILAGTPEESPNYKMTAHWWGMLIDITKCIGCGTCVQACKAENDVPDGYYRTWVERYHVARWDTEMPQVDSPDGVVMIDQKYCLGCRYCIQACPYGCRFLNPETNTASKCALCYHRITKGLTTACCETCPTGARQLVDFKNSNDPIHKFLETHSVQVLKPYMATKAKVYYFGLDGSVR